MNNPDLYTSVNDLQKRDAKLTLDRVKPALNWNKNEQVLDVGCGPGDLTVKVLKSYLPEDAHIVGCDISESMVKYAQSKFGNDYFDFRQLDIGNSNIWMNWDEASFDKIFSFYCLNWVKDQNQAARNMYSLLKSNGHLITMFTIEHPFITFFEYLISQPKWSSNSVVWSTWDVLKGDSTDPRQEYIKILKSCNFDVLSCEIERQSFTHPTMEEFIGYFESVNPFVKKIPSNEARSFLEECAQTMLDQGLIVQNNKGEITHEYIVLITHAKKGINILA